MQVGDGEKDTEDKRETEMTVDTPKYFDDIPKQSAT